MPEQISSVRKLAYQLFIRLPRLIRHVRALEAGDANTEARDVIKLPEDLNVTRRQKPQKPASSTV